MIDNFRFQIHCVKLMLIYICTRKKMKYEIENQRYNSHCYSDRGVKDTIKN